MRAGADARPRTAGPDASARPAVAAVHEHITDAVKTPDLIRLTGDTVLARFETMKVYAALGAVRSLLRRGRVVPGQTLVDSSSGIYALALAMACHRYGLRCHIVASTTVDATMRAQLEILGATVDAMPPSQSLRLDQELRVRHVRRLLAERPDFHWMRQYHDQIHHEGYREFAELLTGALPDGPLTVVGAVGTGASTGGLARALRESGRPVRLVGIQPFGSVTFGSERFEDPEAIIAGIGSSIPFGNVRHELYDTVHWLDFRHAMAGAVGLLREHAVFAGLSTGAAHLAASWEAARDPGRLHLVLGADTGHRYAERVFTRHAEALDPAGLRPRTITSPADLRPPWSVMEWAGRAAPEAARTAEGDAPSPVPTVELLP
ncbi:MULTISPECIES: pyridoxal-phosphate dependent enzyme [Streptomyces]|uniref:Pyridoxal-phosphate dependent enzyme n=2 Tax=Streptomyces TaxID=1883 RepID=A0A7K3RBK5_STRAQ|nr:MULTISPECIES: pyridoxal-phosphate dependent enzyme [Streptomyces]NEB99590.1 pyridoxal-phosphate dependent enzyme [Streptomyces anulatus]NEC00072.1 pyridoxal-phosphate dependent enzyme [Streptomyces anulatus]NED29215.1 pyridoxal-phosphate dependent enzyme [Streptomyces anulatus]OWA17641.1 cysteine synthase [Streptomyces sp. CS057]